MIFDSGKVTVCSLQNIAEPGHMPVNGLVPVFSALFAERVVGYSRFYQAQGVNEHIDMLIRIWRNTAARIGMYAVLSQSENDGQYRITNVQQAYDDDGLKVTELTLERMDELYEIAHI